MIAVAVRFIAGRYHATPWGRHVNEGVVEWPPSPWRFLRALVATWKRTLSDVPTEAVLPVFAALAAPPDIRLPVASPAHTRHYMPLMASAKTSMVFDTFAAVSREEVVVLCWRNAVLSGSERETLQRILDRMPYLGRAESWCEATLVEDAIAPNCRPLIDRAPGNDEDPVPVLLPEELAPEALLDALLVETGELRGKEKRLLPSGSRWVSYARPTDRLIAHPRRRAPEPAPAPITIVRYALDAKPLPLLTDAITVGELARAAAMSWYGRYHAQASSEMLSGRAGSKPHDRQHQHAFYQPTDEDGDGRLDHLTVYCAAGLSAGERQALGRMDVLQQRGEDRKVRLLLLGMMSSKDLADSVPYWHRSAEWESITPYMLARHPKRHRDGRPKLADSGEQKDGPEDQIRREWAQRCKTDPSLPAIVEVRRIEACTLREEGSDVAIRQLRWLQFRRWRSRGDGTATGLAYGFRLRFADAVTGPVALGYGCHFGLGQFRPVHGKG